MTGRRGLLGALVAGLAALSGAPAAHAIVGGSVTTRDWPFMVQYRIDGDFTCGGSLIAPDVVLTAQHCVVESEGRTYAPSRLSVVLGRAKLSGSDGAVVGVRAVEPHPTFDAALLRLNSASSQTPVRIIAPDQGALWSPGTNSTVIGWGAQFSGGDVSDDLREVSVPVVSDSDCSSTALAGFDPAREFCAGRLLGGGDSCQGDSGGPIMVLSGDRWIQIGIVSNGLGCAFPTQYGRYTRLAAPAVNGFVAAAAKPAPTPSPSPSPSPSPGPSPTSTPSPSAAPTVRLVRTALGSAARAKRARKVTVELRVSDGSVRSLRVTLLRGSTVVGRSSVLAKVSSRRLVRVGLTAAGRRTLRRGRVTVRVAARSADGRAVSLSRSASLSR